MHFDPTVRPAVEHAAPYNRRATLTEVQNELRNFADVLPALARDEQLGHLQRYRGRLRQVAQGNRTLLGALDALSAAAKSLVRDTGVQGALPNIHSAIAEIAGLLHVRPSAPVITAIPFEEQAAVDIVLSRSLAMMPPIRKVRRKSRLRPRVELPELATSHGDTALRALSTGELEARLHQPNSSRAHAAIAAEIARRMNMSVVIA